VSFNGTGTFLINTAGQPVVTGTTITSTAFNALTADLATGLSTAITKDGQTVVTGNIPFNSFKITGLGAPTAINDALTYNQPAVVSTLIVGSLSGVLIGNGSSSVVTAGTAGTDYVSPSVATTFTAKQTFNGSSSVLAVKLINASEAVTVSATAATGTINYNVTTQSVLYYTSNASANWTVNLRASSGTSMNTALGTGESVTVAFLVTQGATPYYNNVVQVDGTTSGVTTKWLGEAPTTGLASSINTYTYTVIKTASATFTVLVSLSAFV
jgi:hypothetical protein